jgi:bleomycin hydrolase
MKYLRFVPVLLVLFTINIAAQDKNLTKSEFRDPKEGFYDEILRQLNDYTPSTEKKKTFRVDFTGIDIPKSPKEFTSYWHNDPVSQGRTGTCWCFSTTSFFESEINRQFNVKVKLSEIHTVYYEYLEKTKRFVKERGNSVIGEGSEGNAVCRIWEQYGVVPESVYDGLPKGQKFHDHKKLFDEVNTYLQGLKTSNAWDEETAVKTVRSILNHYLGEPPTEFVYEGKKYTPLQFLKNYVKLNLDDYVDILSLKEKPFYKQVEYGVEDNWWHDSSYYNVPLDEFIGAVKSVLKNGGTCAIGGDVSEPGHDGWHNAAIVPTFDIPAEYINDDAREFRFSNGTTQDDHGLHAVGYLVKDGTTWFLIKDSGSGSRNGDAKGYYFYREDYVKLKIMDFMVHKDYVKDLLKKFN